MTKALASIAMTVAILASILGSIASASVDTVVIESVSMYEDGAGCEHGSARLVIEDENDLILLQEFTAVEPTANGCHSIEGNVFWRISINTEGVKLPGTALTIDMGAHPAPYNGDYYFYRIQCTLLNEYNQTTRLQIADCSRLGVPPNTTPLGGGYRSPTFTVYREDFNPTTTTTTTTTQPVATTTTTPPTTTTTIDSLEVFYGEGFTTEDADVLRLYQAFFNRKPDVAGVAYWLDLQSSGLVDMDDLAYAFAASVEFKQNYGEVTDEQFLRILYRNMLHRTPDAEGFNYWIGKMNDGLPRHLVVRWVVANSEFINAYQFGGK